MTFFGARQDHSSQSGVMARSRTCIYSKASLSVEIGQLRLLVNPD